MLQDLRSAFFNYATDPLFDGAAFKDHLLELFNIDTRKLDLLLQLLLEFVFLFLIHMLYFLINY